MLLRLTNREYNHVVSDLLGDTTHPADEFPDAVRAALAAGELDGVLHLSRRSAETYLAWARRVAMLDRALLPKHYCLSAQVAEPLIAAGARNITVAPRPDEAALIDLLMP